MIQALSIRRAMGFIALFNVIAFLAALTFVQPVNFVESVRLVFLICAVLDAMLAALFYFGWEWIWRRLPILNTWIFPNLNGTWNMTIHWVGPRDHGVVHAKATIKLNFLSMSMEVASPGSDSETMMVQPKKDPESGRPLMYYFYRVIPRKIDNSTGAIYEGAAILRFDATPVNVLHGNYFTSKQTTGHFELVRQ